MSLSFEMPLHLTSSPKSASIYQVVHPIFLNHPSNLYPDKNPKPYLDVLSNGYTDSGYQMSPKLDPLPLKNINLYWQKRLDQLGEIFKITGEVQQIETADRLILQNERYNLHVYKASNSFAYFDQQLASPTDPAFTEKLISEPAALKKANDQLKILGVQDEYIQFGGIGYTGVSVGNDKTEASYPLEEEYKTEVKVYYGFKIDGLPVFGSGAKTIVCYTGTALSQLIYFWRQPGILEEGNFISSKVALDRPLISQEEALNHFAHDNRFTKLKKGNAKVRFHNVQLGYYAKSPQAAQRFLYPVYQVNGTVETWKSNENGFSGIKEQVSGDVFRYNFTLHMLAVSDPNTEEKKMFGTNGKTVAIF